MQSKKLKTKKVLIVIDVYKWLHSWLAKWLHGGLDYTCKVIVLCCVAASQKKYCIIFYLLFHSNWGRNKIDKNGISAKKLHKSYIEYIKFWKMGMSGFKWRPLSWAQSNKARFFHINYFLNLCILLCIVRCKHTVSTVCNILCDSITLLSCILGTI